MSKEKSRHVRVVMKVKLTEFVNILDMGVERGVDDTWEDGGDLISNREVKKR